MNEMTHAEKLRLSGITKYGSEEAWRRAMSDAGRTASRPGTGGFKHLKGKDPERLRQISIHAARTRWNKPKEG